MKNLFSAYWPGLLIVLLSVFIGVEVYQDYGISYDELSQRFIGEETYKYAIGKNPDYINLPDKDHGPGFEWVLMSVEKTLHITDNRDIYLMRHMTTFLFFLLCMFSGYILVLKLFNNKILASIALIALIYHPRLFAHSFFNPKDIPAAGIFLVSMAATYWAFSGRTFLPYFVLGIICGFSASIRLPNMVIAAPIGLFFFFDIARNFRDNQVVARIFGYGLLVFAGFCATLYISWPALWHNPVSSFMEMYRSYANFRWVDYVLFDGKKVLSTELPWNYIPTWMFITIPELWIILGSLGIVLFTAGFIRKPGKYITNSPDRIVLLAFICFFLPLVMIIVQHSVLYDGWRHMYFIYPPFIIMMCFALDILFKKGLRQISIIACILQVLVTGWFMIKYHPFQQVYFNHFISHEENYLYNHFELDYWASCHKQAVEWVDNHREKSTVNINRDNAALRANYHFLPADVRERVIETKGLDSLDYYIEFFRTNPFKFPDGRPNMVIVHDEKVLNSPIYRIVKMR